MNITCEKETLIEGLNLVGRTVSNRTTLPILECVLLTADDNGLRLTANDLEMSIETAPLNADVTEPGTVALDAKLFSEIVRKMPGEFISIQSDKNNVTQCTSGRAKFRIMGKPGEDFPLMPEAERTQGYALKAYVLKEMIRQTIFSVAVDESKPILTGELIQFKDNTLVIVSVDGFRISYRRAVLQSTNPPISAVVPAKSLNELSRVLPSEGEEEVSFFFTDKRAVFELPRFTFMSRLLEGEFIRYDQIFNEDFTTIVTTERLPFVTALERAVLVSRDVKKSPVKLEIKDDSIIITSNTDTGNAYDEIPCDIDGQDLEIAFNPRYLIESLRAVDDNEIIVKFTTALSPCIIKGAQSDAFKYLILPLRLRS